MAYMNQSKKTQIKQNLDLICKPLGIKYSLKVRSHMTIAMTIKSAPVDFITNYNETAKTSYQSTGWARVADSYIQVNPYHYQNNFTGKTLEVITKIMAALKSAGWYDNSDAQTDYFDTAYYTDLDIGSWDKPYQLTV
jgi:hypothetical protein